MTMKRLESVRKSQKISLTQLSKRITGMGWSISPETLAKYECGESEPTISDTKKIAKALGVTPAYLVGWDGDTWYKEQPTRYSDDANLCGLEDEISFADAYLSKSYDLYREIYLGTVKDFGEDDGVLANLHFADVGIGIASARHDLLKAQRAMNKARYYFDAKKKRGIFIKGEGK